jgi:hypothetical protein
VEYRWTHPAVLIHHAYLEVLVMKIAVIILGLLGAIAGGGLGVKWISDISKNADVVKLGEEKMKSLEASGNTAELAKLKKAMGDLQNATWGGYLLVIGALVGLAALVMLIMGKISPMVAGIMLILGSVAAGIFAPPSLIFSGAMIVAGGLCFLMKPKGQSQVVA